MDIYEKYWKIKTKMQVLNDELAEVQSEILEEVMKLEHPMKREFGTFTKVTSKKYQLSEEAQSAIKDINQAITQVVTPLKEELKRVEARDIESGKAKVTESVSLRFTEKKN